MTIFKKGDLCRIKRYCKKCKKDKHGSEFYFRCKYCKECTLRIKGIIFLTEKLERAMTRQSRWSQKDLGLEYLDKDGIIKMFTSDLTACFSIVYDQAVDLYNKKIVTVYNRNEVYCQGGENKYLRLKILQDSYYTCYYCGGFGDTVDHVIPLSKQGKWVEENLVCSCTECNTLKADMSFNDFLTSGIRIMKPKNKSIIRNKNGISIDKY